MTFDNNNSLKPTRKEEGVTQSGLIEKKVKDIEDQIDDIKERLTPLENTVEGFENEVNTDSVVAAQVHSGHDYTDELSVSGDADVQGTISAAKVTAADVEVSNKVKTKDVQVTNDLTVEGTGTFAQLSAENFDIETFNADELNATELSSDNADITNLASDSITADAANITAVTSETVTTENITVSDTVTAKDAVLSGDLSADDVTASNVKVSDTADVLKFIAETMQSGRLFIAPEQMFLIPENGWIHFHNVNAGRFILYLTDFTDTTTNIHSLGNVKFSAVIDYVNNSEKGAVKVLYVQSELKSFEAVYVADNGEIWFKRSSQYLNARRAVVFAESEKELIVDTFAENAQTFDVSEAKSITLKNFNNDAEIVKEKFLKGDYTIDGNVRITGYLTPGQVISERALFLGYSDYVTADSDGILSAKGAIIDGNLSVIRNANLHETQINGELTVDADINAATSVHVDKDVSIKGDLYVQGVTYQTEETNVSTTGDYIVTRDNNNTPLGSGEYSGLAVNNYDTGKIATLTADSNGEWRVSDSATATAQTYTNVSEFNGGWFSGITQTAITAIKGIFTNISGDELADVVLYNGSDYYHFDGVTWYGTVSVSNGKLVKGSAVTDAALITALEALTKHTLVYYASVTVKEIDASTNQPLLTRAEANTLNNNDILVWDSLNKRAVGAFLLDLTHPVGSLYWTSSNENPAVTFGGGTWTQIKDCFVWAKGDNDTVNATGGAKTVTLEVANLPSHNHSYAHTHEYTPSGKIASTSGGTDNKVASENSHTHEYTPDGSISVTTNPTSSTTLYSCSGPGSGGNLGKYISNSWLLGSSVGTTNQYSIPTSVNGGVYKFTGTTKSTGAGTAHSHTAYFTGTKASTTSQSNSTTGSTGSGTAVNIMPPYIVKYCWERTA